MNKIKKIIIVTFAMFVYLLSLPAAAFAQSATLSLSPSTGTFNPGCTFTTNILLNTGGGATDGTDAILTYDTTKLSTDTNSIASGTIYPEYPGNNVDQSTGKITISGLASVTSAFTGQGNLATITFTVKPDASAGTAQVNFSFDSTDKANTTDSNVVERGTVTDILNSVVNGAYTIGTGTNCTTGAKVVPAGGTGILSTPSANLVPKTLDQAVGGSTGSEQQTFTIAIVGSVLVILGAIGLAIL